MEHSESRLQPNIRQADTVSDSSQTPTTEVLQVLIGKRGHAIHDAHTSSCGLLKVQDGSPPGEMSVRHATRRRNQVSQYLAMQFAACYPSQVIVATRNVKTAYSSVRGARTCTYPRR